MHPVETVVLRAGDATINGVNLRYRPRRVQNSRQEDALRRFGDLFFSLPIAIPRDRSVFWRT